jgi:hypothetical protein
MTEQFQLCEWGHCHLGKLHRCSEIMSGSWDAPDYPACQYTPCSNLAMKGNSGTNRIPHYWCPNHHCWNLAFWIVGFLGCSPNVNCSWCREQREGQLIWPYNVCVLRCLMSRFYCRDAIVYTSVHYFQ